MEQRNIEILPYKKAYRTEILAIWEASVLATHDFLASHDFEEIKTLVSTIDFASLKVFCLLVDQQVVGFIGIDEQKIEMLFLSPDYFGQGLGKLLMEYAMHTLSANQVDVNEQNEKALKFYQKIGFEVIARNEKDGQGKDYPILVMKIKI
jgi:putative acetyltransferase